MKKLFLFLAAAVCSLTMSAKAVYLDTNGPGYWGDNYPEFFIWSWNDDGGVATPMKHVEDDVYYGIIPEEHVKLLFVRMPTGYEKIDWDAKWNQTQDEDIPTDGNNLYTIESEWTEAVASGKWSTYSPSLVCTYSVKMTDAYGDGWEGGAFVIEDNGVEQTIELGGGLYETVPVESYGGTPTFTWNNKGYRNEVGYFVMDANGRVLAYHEPYTTFVNEFTIDDPCAFRAVPDAVSGLDATLVEDFNWSFSWDAHSDADSYVVKLFNPYGRLITEKIVTENSLTYDFQNVLKNGDYRIEVYPADGDGVPMIGEAAEKAFNIEFPKLGEVTVRFLVPEYSDLDMSLPANIYIEGTNYSWDELEAKQEGSTRWWSATFDMADPAINYVRMTVGPDAPIRYAVSDYSVCTENTYCLQVGSFRYDDDYGSFKVLWYDADVVDCDKELIDYTIASAKIVGGEGGFTITVNPKSNEAPYYKLYIYSGPTDALEYEGYVTFSGLEETIPWYISMATDITYWVVVPLDENEVESGPYYESYEVVTVLPSPYVITNLAADAVGDNTYKISWDYKAGVEGYWVYVEDYDGNTVVSKYVASSDLSVEGGKFVFVTPAFGIEGEAYVEVESYDGKNYPCYAYTFFDVSGLIAMSDAKIRVLIPTDNNMDISDGVWFWWWPAGETTGSLVKATEEGGRWFSADIKPNAAGYQFVVVNKEIKSDEDWKDAQQSYDSPAVGAADVCFALASKYTSDSKWSLFATDCSAVDHDYRYTLSFDNSVANKITVILDAKEYAPNYEIAWRVKDSGDSYKYKAHHMTATENTFTLDIPVTEDTEFEYKYFVNDEDWNLMIEDSHGTFTVKAEGGTPDYPPYDLNVAVDGQKATLTWSAPIEVEYCVLNVTDPLTSTDVVYENVTGVAGDYSYEYTFADGDERTLEWGVFSRIGSAAVSGWVYGDDFKAEVTLDYSVENLTAVAAADNCYKISWDVNTDVPQYYIFVEDHQHNPLVDDHFKASDLTIESGKYVLITPPFAVEGEAYVQVWSCDYYGNQKEHQLIGFDVSGLSKLTSAKIRVLIPTDNNMDISSGVWFWWWPAGTTDGQIVEATDAGGRWFEADITLNAAGYQFLVVNKEIKSASDWDGVQQSEDSPIITTDEACFEQLFNLKAPKWKLAADEACDNPDHDYRFTVDIDNTTAGGLSIELNAVDYAPKYVVYFRAKGTTDYAKKSYEGVTASTNTIDVVIGTPIDAEFEYILYACALDETVLAAPAAGEVTVIGSPTTYTLNIAAGPNGKVNDEVNGIYNEGDKVTIIATPDEGYKFDKWSDGNTEATRELTMDKDYDLFAYFVEQGGTPTTFTLHIASAGGGKVNEEVNKTYDAGAVVTIVATPDAGWDFANWSDGNTSATRSITMDKDYNLIAYFTTTEEFAVKITATKGGSLDPDNYSKKKYVTGGTVIEVEAIADDDYEFVGWSDGVSTAKRKIVIVQDTDLVAEFEEIEYVTLKVVVDPAGTATVYFDKAKQKNNTLEVEAGSVVNLTFEAADGYELDYWQDGKKTSDSDKYKVTVDTDKTVTLHMREISESIRNIEAEAAPVKVLRNGTIYIIREGKVYTITGRLVE